MEPSRDRGEQGEENDKGLEERCGYKRSRKIDGVRSGNDRLKRAVEEKRGRRVTEEEEEGT